MKLEVIEMKSYPVIIEQDGTGYIVTCPSFKGCYSQGDTIDEALKNNIKEAIELCLDDEEKPIGSIPDHKELRPGLLKKILKDADLT